MLQINFYPDYDNPEFMTGLEEYKSIWEAEKEKIIAVLEKVSGLKFRENNINAIVFSGISNSHPLALRHDLDSKFKKENLVHELGHRILSDLNKHLRKNIPETDHALELHKALNLILFDVFVELWGEEYAKEAVEYESNSKRPLFYKQAWDWALSFSKEERQNKFETLLSNVK